MTAYSLNCCLKSGVHYKTWEAVGNKFEYDGVPGTHQWYDGTHWQAQAWQQQVHIEDRPRLADAIAALTWGEAVLN